MTDDNLRGDSENLRKVSERGCKGYERIRKAPEKKAEGLRES